jgi:hypothetical protein
LRRTQEKYKPSGLKPDAWANFLLDYKGEVGSSLTEYLARSRENAKAWRGTPPLPATDLSVALIADLPAPPGTGTLGQKAAVRRVLVEIWAVRGPKTDVSRAADQQLGVALNRQEGRTSRLLAPIGK